MESIGIYGGIGSGLIGASWAEVYPIFNYEPRSFFNKDTFSYNFNADFSQKEIPPSIKDYIGKNYIVAIGNPGCNVFSLLSTRKKHKITGKDFINTEVFKYISLIGDLKPSFFIMENIPRLLDHIDITNRGIYIEYLKEEDKGGYFLSDYHLTWEILNPIDFGVPQKRRRVFIVGSRYNKIEITTSRPYNPVCYRVNVGGAFKDISKDSFNHKLPKHSKERVEGFSKLKPGESYYGTQNNRRLFLDKPSGVVTSSCSRAVHPVEPRTLTVRETARLMGYPDDFKFYGGLTSQLDQVGKAVVPQVVWSIVRDILDS